MRWVVAAFMLVGCVSHSADDASIGARYLGARYQIDPLGEECSPDTDPLIRTDAFDCTTFVETSLASGDVDALTRIRYKNGVVDFKNRNHFIESDWISNNSDIVKNASAQYGKPVVRHVVIDRAAWLRRVHNIDADDASIAVDMEYIPYQNITTINNTEPMVVLFIVGNDKKSDTLGTDLAVVHMGFLLPGGTLRHASSVAGHVVDVDFYEYIAVRTRNKNDIGITLLEILK